ncbi:MAG: phage major capsid protein [Nocardioidaceae bacterium]
MPTLIELRGKRRDVHARATALASGASEANRYFTDDEQHGFETLTAELDALDAEIEHHPERRRQDADNAFRKLAGGPAPVGDRSNLPLPADLAGDELRSLHEAARSRQPLRVEARAPVSGVGGTVVSPPLAGADYLDVPRVASLFTSQTTESPTVRTYVVSQPATAEVVAEGAAKPDSGVLVTGIDLKVTKIAAYAKVTTELIADFGSFTGVISGELSRSIVARENGELTSTLLAAPLATQASSAGIGVDETADAIATLQALGIAPDAIVMAPTRLATVRKQQAANGSYVVDPLTGGPATLHGLRVVVTPELADTTVLVGRFRDAGIVYVRETVSVQTGYSGTDFIDNLLTLLAEERLALSVTQPGRILNLDLT